MHDYIAVVSSTVTYFDFHDHQTTLLYNILKGLVCKTMAADNLYGHLKMIYFHHPCIIQDIWFNFIIVIVHIEV